MHHSQFTAAELLLDESFLRYCNNAPDADVQYWQSVRTQNPEVEKALELFRMMQLRPAETLKADARRRLEISLDTLERPQSMTTSATVRRLPWKWAAAAAILVLAVTSYVIFRTTPVHYTTFAETGLQDRRELTLPDGTTVILNAASTLQLGDHFSKNNRQVFLTGEAYFDVKPDAALPFIVETRKTATTVLGTAFKVRSYPADEQELVTLASGKVKVKAQATTIALLPGEEAVYAGGAIKKTTYRQTDLQHWLERKVIFDKAGINQIISTLEEFYGLKVKLENRPSGTVMFTGVFNDQQLNVVLDAISFTNNFTYRLQDNEVLLRF